jgi:subtilisin family serine protease
VQFGYRNLLNDRDHYYNGLNAAIFDADVINMSFGGTGYDQGEANAVAQAWNYNIVLVATAGNNGGPTIVYPANYSNVIGVSGVLPDKSFASTSPCNGASSNHGSDVDLAAPFYALSTVPGGYDDESGGWCGTSMATPHVSGTAALVRAHNPSWTNQQIVNQLFNTAEDLGAPGRDDYFGYGLVDAANALGIAPPPPPLTVSITGPSQITHKGTYTWTASADGGTGGYTYQWSVDYDSGPHYQLGTASSQPLTVYGDDGNFTMSVTVTSGGSQASDSQYVYNCINSGSNCVPAVPVGGG